MKSLGQWCVQHRVLVLVMWVLVLVGLGGAVATQGSNFTDTTTLPHSESGQAYELLAQATNGESTKTDAGTIAWKTTNGTSITDPTVTVKVQAVLDQIAKDAGVAALISPYTEAGAQQMNPAKNTAFATIAITDKADADQIRDQLKTLDSSALEVTTGGQAFFITPGVSGGTEGIGIIAALVVLFLVFRSRWAAALPIITGVTGVGVSLCGVILLSHLTNMAETSITMASLIGLGVGIDYALFIVNRHRKSLMTGASVKDSVATASNTSGRAVIFAGLTVMMALIAIRVVNLGILTAMAQAAAITVACTVLAAITLLPALLGMLGTKVLSKKQRAQLAGTGHEPARARAPMAARWAGVTGKAPIPMAIAALAVVAALAIPALQIRVMDSDASADPKGSATNEYYTMTSAAFGDGFDAQLLLVASTPDAASTQAFDALVADLPNVASVASVATYPLAGAAGTSAVVVIPSSSAQTQATEDLVKNLRNNVIPSHEQGTTLEVSVGGTTATAIDLANALMGRLPLYLGLIAILGFWLLAIAFRSIAIPLVGALSNLVTIAVGLGVVTMIFQKGWGSALLGVGSGAPLNYMVPVVLVGILFGLSMDYQVFLVSRIQEEWALTRDNRRAVRVGVTETGRVICAAAIIMFCVFASFGFSGQRIIAAIGVGMASAVLVDAFVVRMTLMPAIMRLLGRANWWYPRWADRITLHLSIEGSSDVHDAAQLAGRTAPGTEPAQPARDEEPALV